MNLEDAATYFDDTPVYDGYTGDFLWHCQFSSFNDANAVGSTSTRRILSIAPGLVLPGRRVLQIFDDRWLVGDGNPDAWIGDKIRQSFNMKKANALAEVLTPTQACLGTTGTTSFYAQKIYFKDSVNVLNDADTDPYWNIFIAPGEPVTKGKFLRIGGELFRVRSDYVPLENLRIAQSDEVDAGPVTAVFDVGTYDPLTDTTSASTVTTTVVMLDFTKLYRYQAQASERVAAGDTQILVAAAVLPSPKTGSTVLISGVTWRIFDIVAEADAWLLHLRHA